MNKDAKQAAIALAILAIAAFFISCAEKTATAPTEARKVVVIGMDGLEPSLLERWIASGELPAFAQLAQRGMSGRILSTIPSSSPPAWTTAITGVNPGVHGIFGFIYEIRRDERGEFGGRFSTSLDRQVQPIWNLAGFNHKRSVIINIPLTDPPEDVPGIMISGFPHIDPERWSFPTNVALRFPDYRLDSFGVDVRAGEEETFLNEIQDIHMKRRTVVNQLLDEGDWDLFWAVFTAPDRVQHYFWKYFDSNDPRYTESGEAKFGRVVKGVYRMMNDALVDVMSRLDENTDLIVISDHGFGPVYRLVNGESFLSEFRSDDMDVVAASNFGASFTIRPKRESGSEGESSKDVLLMRARLARALADLRDPETGTRVIEEVYFPEDIYSGPQLERAPDIIAKETETYLFYNWKTELEELDLFYDAPDRFFSAFHRRAGIFLANGPDIVQGATLDNAHLEDLLPTVLYLLGAQIPVYVDGQILESIISPSVLDERPPETSDIAPDSLRREVSAQDAEEAAERIEEQLRSLGYIQ